MVRARHDVRDELRLLRIGHGWFEDADDGRDAWTETNRLANHGRVALEHRRPEPVREHHRARRPGAIIGGVQQAAEHRAKSHDVEKRPVDDTSLHDARLLAEADQREVDGGKIAERGDRRDARLEVIDFRDREGEVLGPDALGGLADIDQPIRVPIDERTEEHTPNDTENRRIGADAQREGDDDGQRQSLGASE